MELSCSNIKKIITFSQRKSFLIFSQKKFFLIFPKMEPYPRNKKIPPPKKKLPCISGHGTQHLSAQAQRTKKIHPKKISCTSKNKNPKKNLLYFLKRKLFLHVRIWNFSTPNLKKILTYQEGTLKS